MNEIFLSMDRLGLEFFIHFYCSRFFFSTKRMKSGVREAEEINFRQKEIFKAILAFFLY